MNKIRNPYLSLVNDVLGFGTSIPTKLDITVQKPSKRPSSASYNELSAAADKRVKEIGMGRKAPDVELVENKVAPGIANRLEAMARPNDYGSIESLPNGDVRVHINPNADRAYFAHELGHAAARQTDIGQAVHQLRHKNWNLLENVLKDSGNVQLSKALLAAAALTGGTAAALTPGDEEYLGALALAAGASAPTLIDEALATKNGLAILEGAGMPATAGQRARLAGGLLSYMAPTLLIGTAAPLIGNQFD